MEIPLFIVQRPEGLKKLGGQKNQFKHKRVEIFNMLVFLMHGLRLELRVSLFFVSRRMNVLFIYTTTELKIDHICNLFY